ncbi:MAG: Hpt domain-containing protein [Defluviimonas sp.]|nr:Hpt domain-containing protein [Defluviimonas sp.]
MISWERVADLKADFGEDGFAEVVAVFLEEFDAAVAELGAAKDGEALARALHFLKGGALNLGFTDVGALCGDGEKHVRAGTAGDGLVDRIAELYALSRAEFLSGIERTRA